MSGLVNGSLMLTTDAPTDVTAATGGPARTVPQAPVRRPRRVPARRGPRGRDQRFRGPRLRRAPIGWSDWSTAGRPGAAHSGQACSVVSPSRWRLTDRGIAVVLVTGLLVVVAAVTVVTATALRVTGEDYQPISAVAGR